MKSFKILKKFLSKFEEAILYVCIIGISVIVFANVVSRYVFNYSWTPTEELCKFMTIWMTGLGASYCARKGTHIVMSAFFDMIPVRGKKVLIIIISIFNSLFCFLMTFFGYQYTVATFISGQVSSALRAPIGPIYLVMPISFFLMGIQYTITIVKNIREKVIYIGPEEDKAEMKVEI